MGVKKGRIRGGSSRRESNSGGDEETGEDYRSRRERIKRWIRETIRGLIW